jgi:hypothetical protein
MVTVWFGVGQFLSGAMGQLYPGGDTINCVSKEIIFRLFTQKRNSCLDL